MASKYLYQCSEVGCWYRLLLKENESWTHNCPHGADTHIGLSVTMTLVQQCWEDLDSIMDQLMDPTKKLKSELGKSIWRSVDDQIKYENLKGQARGMAVLLARFMVPFFRTADDIAKEAKRRHDHRQRGEDYETPGLNSRKYEFPSDNKYSIPKQKVTSRASSRTTNAALSAADKIGIKSMKGIMKSEEIAAVYAISVDQVNALWS